MCVLYTLQGGDLEGEQSDWASVKCGLLSGLLWRLKYEPPPRPRPPPQATSRRGTPCCCDVEEPGGRQSPDLNPQSCPQSKRKRKVKKLPKLPLIIIIIIEGLSLLQSIPPTTANKQTQAHKKLPLTEGKYGNMEAPHI